MSRRKHAVHEEEHENHERWLVSYADMVTLLFALFIVLYAMSIIDLDKYRAFQQSFSADMGQGVEAVPGEDDTPSGLLVDEEPGPGEGALSDASLARPGEMPEDPPTDAVPGPEQEPAPEQPPETTPEQREELAAVELEDLKEKVEATLEQAGLASSVQVTIEKKGLVVFVSDAVLFTSGEADLLPEGADLVGRLAAVVAGVGNDVVVEGHTDDVPVRPGRYASNWELSTTRATTVVRRLIDEQGVDAARVSASGFADTRPRFTNDTAEHRSQNRRVELVIRSDVEI